MTEPRVVRTDEAPAVKRSGATVRVLISPESGSRQLLQRVIEVEPSASTPLGHPVADEVLYVVSGVGTTRPVHRDADGERHDVGTGSAFAIRGLGAAVDADRGGGLTLVSVLSPPPFTGFSQLSDQVGGRRGLLALIDERTQEPLPAGDDRTFKLLIGPEHGARNVTQFVGFIDRSMAPPHTHTYEEAIYILDGEGIVHIGDDRREDIGPGTSIFLPPGTPHCLENRSQRTLKLLGVFSPPGSPAAKRES